MKYKDEQKQFTDIEIPKAWRKAVEVEKTAELLVYNMIVQCMDNFSDISIELTSDNPVNAVLRSWNRNENIGFGNNAISLTSKEDGGLIVDCIYDIWKLKEDAEIMSRDMFGSIDFEQIERNICNENVDLPDEKINSLFSSIQKKKIPIRNKKQES